MSILRLPEDISCKIFAFAGPTSVPPNNDSPDFLPSHFDTISPNNVSVVCRRWREIALNDPILWSTIYISLRYPSENEIKKAIIHIEQCLERSRNMPLSCFVSILADFGLSSVHLTSILFCSLFEQQHRWKETKIFIPQAFAHHTRRLDGWPYFVLRTKDLLSLQSFKTNYLRMYRFFGTASFPFLTTLELEMTTHPNTNLWLVASPNLETLVMSSYDPPFGPGIPSRPIALNQLRTLQYDGPLSGLQFLDCPALEDFTVSYEGFMEEIHYYHNFLARCPPSHALRFQRLPSQAREFLRVLLPPFVSKINTLSLSFQLMIRAVWEYSLFEVLSERHAISSSGRPGRFKFVPELEHLEVINEDSTVESVLSFLIARWTTDDRKLASMKLERCSDHTQRRNFAEIIADTEALPAAWSEVKTFVEEGLVLEFS